MWFVARLVKSVVLHSRHPNTSFLSAICSPPLLHASRDDRNHLLAAARPEAAAIGFLAEFVAYLWCDETNERIAKILCVSDWQVNRHQVLHESVILDKFQDVILVASTREILQHERFYIVLRVWVCCIGCRS